MTRTELQEPFSHRKADLQRGQGRWLQVLLSALLMLFTVAVDGSTSFAAKDTWSVRSGARRRAIVTRRLKRVVERRPVRGVAFKRLLKLYRSGRGINRLLKEYQGKVKRRPNRTNLRLILGHLYLSLMQKKQALAKITRQMADHAMYELDGRKDQLASALRLCLVNVLQLLRDIVFPESYARATYETLAPFVQMGGFVIEHAEHIEVFLDGFWQSAKQRDLAEVVARCNAQRFTAPDGRLMKFAICSSPGRI